MHYHGSKEKIVRVATWNLNTWINRKNGVDNLVLWNWADIHLAADLVIFTEAATPPPSAIRAQGWNIVHRVGGFPNRRSWGTLIAGRNMRIEHLTHVGKNKKHELDTNFPGSLTAADVWVDDEYFACVVGLYLPYRKDAKKEFIGHPSSDLEKLKKDFEEILEHGDGSLIVAGDLNDIHHYIPEPLGALGLVDPFENDDLITFRQDWNHEGLFLMDYIYMTPDLASCVTARSGGMNDFPDAFNVSDHAPLLVEMNVYPPTVLPKSPRTPLV